MVDCDTVEQICELILTQYGLRDYITDDAKTHGMHRDDVEKLLNRYRVSVTEDILHYFSGPYREFFQVLLMEYEGESLKNTPYYKALKSLTHDDAVKREFHMEMKLRQLYYRTLLKKAERLNVADRQIATELIGMRIDFLNAQWIYRAKKHYNIAPEMMLIYSLQGGKRLSFARLRSMCYSKTVDEMKKLSKQYLRVDIFSSDKGIDINKNIDKYILRYMKNERFWGNIGSVLSHTYLIGSAIREFTTIIEGVRYKLPKDELRQYLIHLS